MLHPGGGGTNSGYPQDTQQSHHSRQGDTRHGLNLFGYVVFARNNTHSHGHTDTQTHIHCSIGIGRSIDGLLQLGMLVCVCVGRVDDVQSIEVHSGTEEEIKIQCSDLSHTRTHFEASFFSLD